MSKNFILQWNINVISNKNIELTNILNQYSPAIATLSETFLKPGKNINFRGYNCYRKDRNPPDGKGGLLTLVKNTIGARTITHNLPYDRECLITEIVINNNLINVVSIYDKDGHGNTNQLENLIKSQPGTSIIVGDFNNRNTSWGSPFTTSAGENLSDCFDNCNLCLLNDGEPTYMSPSTKKTSHLDLSLCTTDIFPHLTWKVEHIGTSDHDLILIQSNNLNPNWANHRMTWKIKNAKWNDFKTELEKQDECNKLDRKKNTDQIAYNFTEKVIKAADLTIKKSIQKPNSRASPPWWTREIEKAIKNRNRAKNRARKSSNLTDYVLYKKLVAETKNLILKTKKESWNQFVKTITPNTATNIVWKRAKNLTKQTNYSYPTLTKKDLTLAKTDQEKAEALLEPLNINKANDNIANNLNQMFLNKRDNTYEQYNNPFTLKELEEAIATLKEGATGPDMMHNAFLKNLTETYKLDLLYIYNRCWNEGYIPPDWKISSMLPLLKKKKDPTNPENYRPIMLGSCTLKLYEKLIARRFTYFLEDNSLIPEYQFGFRKYIGCENALDSLTSDIQKAIANHNYTVCTFIDAKGAFNNCRKEAIMACLRDLNTPNNIYNFCQNYLTNRKYLMTIGNSSAEITTSHGVPQGGVMAPHLFSIVMNKIPDVPSPDASPGLYADDCKTHSSHSNLQTAVKNNNNALEKINKNAKIWDISFDPHKSKAIIFRNKWAKINTNNINIQLDGKQIQIVDTHKFLGLTYDSKLTWKPHLTNIATSCNSAFNCIKMISHRKFGHSQESMCILYNTLIRSRMLYGINNYSDCATTHFDKLQKLQNKMLKISLGVPASTSNAAAHVLANTPHIQEFKDLTLLKHATKQIAMQNMSLENAEIMRDNTNLKWSSGRPTELRALLLAEKWNMTENLKNIEHLDRIPVNPPWTNKNNLCFNIDWCDTKKADENPNILKQKFNDIFQEQSKNKFVIFTDGSLNPNNNDNGIGIFAKTNNQCIKYKAQKGSSICSIEMQAIQHAVEWATQQNQNNLLVVSDSLSALKCIKNGKYTYESVNYLHSLPDYTHVTFLWTPSHIGIEGNEKADQLANNAQHDQNTIIKGKIPFMDVTRNSIKEMRITWGKKWKDEKTGRLLASMIETPGSRDPYPFCDRRLECCINNLLCDRAYLMSRKYATKNSDTPNCDKCGTYENTEHYLLKCKKFDVQRKVLQSAMNNISAVFDVKNILANQTLSKINQNIIYSALDEYIKNTYGHDELLGLNI